ncbi:hypothetical protein GCM10010451_68700 [Streptomyces virens]|uniref:Secreted protein n=1 Tax=Streptomyces virens TaxID=285572 RepID=A0ABN3V3F0_9ACTN
MSRIFAAVALTVSLFAGVVAIGVGAEESGSSDPLLDDALSFFASGVDIATVIPLVLLAGLLVATMAVIASGGR